MPEMIQASSHERISPSVHLRRVEEDAKLLGYPEMNTKEKWIEVREPFRTFFVEILQEDLGVWVNFFWGHIWNSLWRCLSLLFLLFVAYHGVSQPWQL